MKHLNFIRIGLVAALCMLWSCNSSSNPQDSKEQPDSIKHSSTQKVVSASKGKDIDFSKIRVSSRGIDFLDEERQALTQPSIHRHYTARRMAHLLKVGRIRLPSGQKTHKSHSSHFL